MEDLVFYVQPIFLLVEIILVFIILLKVSVFGIIKKKVLNSSGVFYIFYLLSFLVFLVYDLYILKYGDVDNFSSKFEPFIFISSVLFLNLHFLKSTDFGKFTGSNSALKIHKLGTNVTNTAYISSVFIVVIQGLSVAVLSNTHCYLRMSDVLIIFALITLTLFLTKVIKSVKNKNYFIPWALYSVVLMVSLILKFVLLNVAMSTMSLIIFCILMIFFKTILLFCLGFITFRKNDLRVCYD